MTPNPVTYCIGCGSLCGPFHEKQVLPELCTRCMDLLEMMMGPMPREKKPSEQVNVCACLWKVGTVLLVEPEEEHFCGQLCGDVFCRCLPGQMVSRKEVSDRQTEKGESHDRRVNPKNHPR